MTTKTADVPAVGSTFHVLHSGFVGLGRAWRRGDILRVQERDVESTRDRDGNTWMSLLIDPEGQVRRWGRELFAPGEPPEGFELWDAPHEREEAREAARKLAWAIIDPTERAAALAAVAERFGPPPQTSKTLNGREAKQFISPSGNVWR